MGPVRDRRSNINVDFGACTATNLRFSPVHSHTQYCLPQAQRYLFTKGNDSKLIMIIGIVAIAKNFAIGKDGKLPWHHSADLKFFKETTTGNAIVMGANTWRR